MKTRLLLALLCAGLTLPLWAWDSRTEDGIQIGDAMHQQYTRAAISLAVSDDGLVELNQFSRRLETGCLTEMHELKAKSIDVADGLAVGLNLEAKRVQHKGTNAGTDDIQGWWADALNAYRDNNKQQAYLLLGIMLHMVQDMGVPAHANNVYHQGSLGEFDNFEFNATFHKSFVYNDQSKLILERSRINRSDPRFADPSRYYAYSRDWTRADAPNYNNRDKYPKSRVWPFWDNNDEGLMRDRQARTTIVTYWCLRAAVLAFQGKPNPN